MAQFTFDILGNSVTLYMQYYVGVQNSEQLRLNSNRFECAFIDPSALVSITQLLQATNRALFEDHSKRSKTGWIYSDILYFLSPADTAEEALTHYGICSTSSNILIATFNIEVLETIKSAIEGQINDISQLSKSLNVSKTIEIFSISSDHLSVSHLSDAVYSLLSVKDLPNT